ncbi:unnamed protein product [Mytilus edulis]|uniref:Uncharacterized protein n=1 Tax=Mytilus edulis TaxID=6550 RepID=A0A8S3RN78_MYTED|nr:unnamed protein product [Mytilus edulis]
MRLREQFLYRDDENKLTIGSQECSSDQWQCKVGPCKGCGNGTCIDRVSLCDNEFHCKDRSDEENCTSIQACIEGLNYRCDNGECSNRCNGFTECVDGTDEANCDTQPTTLLSISSSTSVHITLSSILTQTTSLPTDTTEPSQLTSFQSDKTELTTKQLTTEPTTPETTIEPTTTNMTTILIRSDLTIVPTTSNLTTVQTTLEKTTVKNNI